MTIRDTGAVMLNIIGLNHRAQVRRRNSEETDAQREFLLSLQKTIEEFQPYFIAEENNVEFLKKFDEYSIAKEIAEQKNINHIFCDPNSPERIAIGYCNYQTILMELEKDQKLAELLDGELEHKARAIEIGRYFPLREKFWLEKMRAYLDYDGVFICGDGHVESFTKLLDTNQIGWSIAARKIGTSKNEIEDIKKDFEYLRKHPELATWNFDLLSSYE